MLSGSLLEADTFCVDSKDCFSDETLEGADVDAWGRASVCAGVDTSGETSVDAELCTCREMTAEVCVVDAGGTVLVVAAVIAATVATDTGVAVVVDTWVVVTLVVATVMDFSGDDVVVVTVGNEAGAAPVEVVSGGGIFIVFSAVVTGVVVCSLEGAVATGVVTWTPSVGGDVVTVTVLALAVEVILADVVVGEGVQIGVGAAGGFAEDVPATETVVPCVTT